MGSKVVRLEVEAPYQEVLRKLKAHPHASNVYLREIDTTPKVAIICGEHFFLRTSSWGGITIVVIEAKEKTILDVIGFAAASGILKISLGAETSYIKEIVRYLEEDFKINVISGDIRV